MGILQHISNAVKKASVKFKENNDVSREAETAPVPGQNCDVVFFVSSSGHCSLDCHYCIVNPIVKHQPSLNISDFEFLLDQFQSKRPFLAFSGKGDFFAGYRKKDRLLEKLLEKDIEIGLDINGVMIHELPEISLDKLEKIKSVNITLHYEAIKAKNALKVWAKNAQIVINQFDQVGAEMIVGTIFSEKVRDQWEEALEFYKNQIFSTTGKEITLIRDVSSPMSEAAEEYLNELEAKYSKMIKRVHKENFAANFPPHKNVLCPAGQKFFRVWNDGKVEACPYIPDLRDSGNIKDRNIKIREELIRCNQAKFCDCNIIRRLGKMEYEF